MVCLPCLAAATPLAIPIALPVAVVGAFAIAASGSWGDRGARQAAVIEWSLARHRWARTARADGPVLIHTGALDADWTNDDLRELAAIAGRQRMNPADLLLVLTAESGLDPRATNPHGAYGLNQLTRAAAGLVGIAPDRIHEVAKMPVRQQLPLVERYFAGVPWAGRSWPHAPAVYEGNFAPGRMLSRGTDLGTVLYTRADGKAYEANRGLDRDGKGAITVGDLARRLGDVSATGTYRHALGRMRAATGRDLLPGLGVPAHVERSREMLAGAGLALAAIGAYLLFG